jgi:hypothetical protein
MKRNSLLILNYKDKNYLDNLLKKEKYEVISSKEKLDNSVQLLPPNDLYHFLLEKNIASLDILDEELSPLKDEYIKVFLKGCFQVKLVRFTTFKDDYKNLQSTIENFQYLGVGFKRLA